MRVELEINNSSDSRARYLGWAPSPCRARITDPSGAITPVVNIVLRGSSSASAGKVVFRGGTSGNLRDNLTLQLPISGQSVPFFAAGKFGSPSSRDGDVTIEARRGASRVGAVDVMVRIRKNANELTSGERDRFVAAFAQLNNRGMGRFTDFRDMHTRASVLQAHGNSGFLPWHRAYLLDLERELQAIDPSVSLHYWRFDQAAPKVFHRDFMGVPNAAGRVQFNASNPLQFWSTDGVPGIDRVPIFNTSSEPAPGPPGFPVLDEDDTLALGNDFASFREIESSPHGAAHVSFGRVPVLSFISRVPIAARDPLFFMLHCNVDRLWALWQRKNGRFDATDANAYESPTPNRNGHRLGDTMWPWNGVTSATDPTRPPTAPGGALSGSAAATAPGPQPLVSDMLDFQGRISNVSRLGFDYDDVRFG